MYFRKTRIGRRDVARECCPQIRKTCLRGFSCGIERRSRMHYRQIIRHFYKTHSPAINLPFTVTDHRDDGAVNSRARRSHDRCREYGMRESPLSIHHAFCHANRIANGSRAKANIINKDNSCSLTLLCSSSLQSARIRCCWFCLCPVVVVVPPRSTSLPIELIIFLSPVSRKNE